MRLVILLTKKLIDGVMASMLASSVVDFVYGRVRPQMIKLAFTATLLSTQYSRVRAKTDWFRIRIMCPSGATCLLPIQKLYVPTSTTQFQKGCVMYLLTGLLSTELY